MWVVISFFLISCGSHFEQPYEIKKLRVLAVRADSPQVMVEARNNIPSFSPDKVIFDILAADPTSVCKRPNYSVRLFVCIPQQYNDDSSYNLNCEGENGIPLNGLTLNPAQFFLDMMNRYQEIGQTNLPVNVSFDGDRFKFPVSVMAKVSDGREESSAVKFVEFINYPIDNTNPIITRILIDDVDVTASAYRFSLITNRRYRIVTEIDKSRIDKIYNKIDDRYEDEGIQFSFFAQEGEFDKAVTSNIRSEVIYTTPISTEEIYTSIYIVARDFRGGIDWIEMGCIKIIPQIKE